MVIERREIQRLVLLSSVLSVACAAEPRGNSTRVLMRAEVVPIGSAQGPPAPTILDLWHVSTADLQNTRSASVRLGQTRRTARTLRAPFSGVSSIPAGVDNIQLWISPPTTPDKTSAACTVTVRAVWPGAESALITLAAASLTRTQDWLPIRLTRTPRPSPSTMTLSAHPSRDCGGTELWLAVSELQLTGSGPASHRPNIILVVVDTLRRDLFDCTTATSTHIAARWCSRGVYFTDAVSTSSWTYPAVASMLTGLRPAEHGALRHRNVLTDLRPQVTTLPEILGWSGFETAGIISNPYAARGLWRGFDSFVELFGRPGRMTNEDRRASHVVDEAQRFLSEPRAAPFFMFLLFVDLHEPVDASKMLGNPPVECSGISPLPFGWEGLTQPASKPTLAEERRMLCRRALYRDAWRYLDSELGRLMDTLETTGRDQDTAVILVSDHGEEFWEHAAEQRPKPGETKNRWGVDHGHTLYSELVRVPLLLVLPRAQPGPETRTVEGLVSVADVFATTLGIAGVTLPTATSSLDLSPALSGSLPPRRDIVVSESTLYGPDRVAVTGADFRIIQTTPGGLEIFDRAQDPAEVRPLLPNSVIGRKAAALLGKALHHTTNTETLTVTDLEVLRTLGYVR